MAERIVFEGELDLEHLNLIKALSAREMYVEELAQIAERDERIVITGADVGAGGKIGEFKEKYPDRFIDTGIAEADQVGVSAGMALNGKIVYLAGFGPFLALRALNQVHTDVAYQNIPVRIVNTHSGLTSGGGPTHYNIMDLAVMRDLPNMTVIAPSDSAQCIKAIRATLEYPGPVCFRIARGAELAIVLLYSARNKVVRLRVRDIFVHDKLLLSDFIRYSLPVTLNELMWGAGISMNAVIIGHMGSSAVAANSVAQVTRNLATVVAFGIANAAAIMIGKKIGENDYGRAEDYANRFVKLTLAAGVAGGLIILLVRPIVMATMNVTPEAHRYMSVMMLIMSYYVIAQAYNTTMVVGIFRAGGDAKFGLIMDVSTMWGGSILLGAIFAFVFHWSVPAVYAVIMGDELIKVPLTTIRYKSKKWLRNVTR